MQATWKPLTGLNRNDILGLNGPLGRSLSGGFQKDACGNSQSVISTPWKALRFLLVLINALASIMTYVVSVHRKGVGEIGVGLVC